MKLVRRIAGWAGLLSVVALTESSLTTLRADDSKSCRGPSGLTLGATTGKPTYTLYEPVVLTFTVRNPTACRVETGLHIFSGDGIQISIEDHEKLIPYHEGMSSETIWASNSVFEPGDSDTGQKILFYNDAARQLAFPRPGQYRIVVRAHVWNNPDPVLIESEPVSVTVRDVAEADRSAIAALGSVDRLKTLFRNGVKGFCAAPATETCFDDLRLFPDGHSDSSYAPAVMFYYGNALADGVLGAGGADLDFLLNRFLKTWPGHPFESLIVRMAVEESQRLGERDEAAHRLHRFEQKYPEHVSEIRLLRARGGHTAQN